MFFHTCGNHSHVGPVPQEAPIRYLVMRLETIPFAFAIDSKNVLDTHPAALCK
jgi:hypothetical protein